jgi:hypothetical protein
MESMDEWREHFVKNVDKILDPITVLVPVVVWLYLTFAYVMSAFSLPLTTTVPVAGRSIQPTATSTFYLPVSIIIPDLTIS